MIVDVLILNRNLREVTDQLCADLKSCNGVNFIGVIDAGSRNGEISEFTFAKDDSSISAQQGLRPNRGFSLGLAKWRELNSPADFVLLLPNDSILVEWGWDKLIKEIEGVTNVAAIVPLDPSNPYIDLLGDRKSGLAWNFHEGPILLNANFIRQVCKDDSDFFDPNNFRGYLNFIELALRAYVNNHAIIATQHILFRENTSLLLDSYDLIATEPQNENMQLLVFEGKQWLHKKYAIEDRWSFELIVRLLFDEFLRINKDFPFQPIY